MKDFIDIIAESLKDRPDRANVLLLVENLYFTDVLKSRWRRSPASKESARIAHDIINLQNSLDVSRRIEAGGIKSELMRRAVQEVSAEGECKGILSGREVSPEQKEYFERYVLNPKREYVTAVMLADLIRDERMRLRYNQTLTYLLPICTALISATAATILTKLWG